MTYSIIYKDPTENLNVEVDWSFWLNGDAISFSDWSVPEPLALAGQQHTATATIAWLDGGELGQHYTVANTITTAAGRTSKRTLIVRVSSK